MPPKLAPFHFFTMRLNIYINLASITELDWWSIPDISFCQHFTKICIRVTSQTIGAAMNYLALDAQPWATPAAVVIPILTVIHGLFCQLPEAQVVSRVILLTVMAKRMLLNNFTDSHSLMNRTSLFFGFLVPRGLVYLEFWQFVILLNLRQE